MSEGLYPGTTFNSLRLEITVVEDLPAETPSWAKEALESFAASQAGLRPAPTDVRLLAIRRLNEDPIGLAMIALDMPAGGAVTFDHIVIAPDERYRGLGGEAGLAIERRLREAGYSRIFAAVPDTIGLAVYFWLRLGLRPLLEAEAPSLYAHGVGSAGVAGIWMVRETD